MASNQVSYHGVFGLGVQKARKGDRVTRVVAVELYLRAGGMRQLIVDTCGCVNIAV